MSLLRASLLPATLVIVAAVGCAKSDTPPNTPASAPAAATPPAQPASAPASAPAAGTSTQAANSEWGNGTIHRGDAFAVASETTLADVLADPKKVAGTPIRTAGVVARACTKKGCWMELQTAQGGPGVRVSFKDYGFFVPLDSAGATAKIEGLVEVKTLSKADAEHLEGEGAKLVRGPDGTAVELAFVASGVELTKR
jgi:hypothetical protein